MKILMVVSEVISPYGVMIAAAAEFATFYAFQHCSLNCSSHTEGIL